MKSPANPPTGPAAPPTGPNPGGGGGGGGGSASPPLPGSPPLGGWAFGRGSFALGRFGAVGPFAGSTAFGTLTNTSVMRSRVDGAGTNPSSSAAFACGPA